MNALLPILTTSAAPGTDPSVVISPRSRWEPGLQRLRSQLRAGGPWIVAFSGGVDSSFVLHVASEVRDDTLALTAVSPTLPDAERESCVAFTAARSVRHVLVPSNEMEVDGFASNPVNRCYFCKTELYSLARAQSQTLGVEAIADGVNLDDLGDHRPGPRRRQRTPHHPPVGRRRDDEGRRPRGGPSARSRRVEQTRLRVSVLPLSLRHSNH